MQKAFKNEAQLLVSADHRGGGRGGREATRPGTEKRCSHNLQSDPPGGGFKKGQENFPL